MFRFYTAMGLFALAVHGYAQMKGWSVFPRKPRNSRAAAQRRRRAAIRAPRPGAADAAGSSGSGGK
jgi:hypothetical protein